MHRTLRRTLVALLATASLAAHSRAENLPGGSAVHAAAAARQLAGPVAFNAVWEAAAGAPPDSVCPPWLAGVTDSLPAITGGALRIHTTACAKNAHYRQSGSDIAIPETLVVEARLRFASGGECVGPCGHYRQAAGIAINVTGSTGTLFFVGPDEIFLTNGECAGITRVTTPTTDAAHTYRIVVLGATVQVYRDGALALTGSTYASLSDHGTVPRILWGEGTSFAFGTSFWEYVRHNAHATGCITTDVPSGAPGTTAGRALAVHAWPNPSPGETRIAWTTAKTERVRVGVFDPSGRLVRRLLEGELGPGLHGVTWNGRDDGGARLPPGSYLCRVESGAAVGVTRIARVR